MLHKYLHIDVNILINNKYLKEYRRADVVLDVSGRLISDNFGIISVTEHCKDILIPSLLGKPVVIFAQSSGPFRSKLTSWMVKMALNRASLITLREEIRKKYLDRVGINKPPIYVTADPGFLLEPASEKRVQDIFSREGIDRHNKPLIGIVVPEGELFGSNVNLSGATPKGYKSIVRFLYDVALFSLPEGIFQLLMRLARRTGYYSNLKSQYVDKTINQLAQITDYLTQSMDATVLLIAHNTIPHGQTGAEMNDGRVTAKAVYQLVSNKERIVPLADDYAAEELKGIIGQCDLVISMKLHGWIAAVSQYVPAIAIGACDKFLDFLQMVGQEEWLCEQTCVGEVIAKVEDIWIRRGKIREELESRMEAVRERALFNAQLVKRLTFLTGTYLLSLKSKTEGVK